MNSVKWPCSLWLLRAPAWCSEGHRFDSCWGLRVFLCLTFVLCWSVHFSLFQLEEQVPYFFSNLQRSICQGSNFFSNYPIKEIIAQALNSLPTKGMPLNGTINFSTTSRQKLNYKCWRYRSDNLLFQMKGGTTRKRQVFLMPHECIKKGRDLICKLSFMKE